MVYILILSAFVNRLRKDAVFRLVVLTDSFTWDENPLLNEDTGNSSMTSWISRMNQISRNISFSMWGYFICQEIVQLLIIENPPLLLPGWFPFDTNSSPGYEIATLFQVSYT